MNFVSWAFLLTFFPVFLYRLTLGKTKTEWHYSALIIATSSLFIAWHIPAYIFIAWITILTDYWATLLLVKYEDDRVKKKRVLLLSLTVNLGLLFSFKYSRFFCSALNAALSAMGSHVRLPELEAELPIAISFYTFCSMSYIFDVYNRRITAVQSLKEYYHFITFFPHLVSGPILRAHQFLYQINRRRRPCLKVFNEGAYLIMRGLFLKCVCSNHLQVFIALKWNPIHLPNGSSIDLALLSILFGFQLFCDFEGYTSMARGIAYWLGYRFPINFNYPFLAKSFSDFWSRWHITLSQWLKDYLYIPLGGNRGTPLRTSRNLLIVMLVGGLWHGANWTFVCWGALNGIATITEHYLGYQRQSCLDHRWKRITWYLVTQGIFFGGMILFRSTTLHEALLFISGLLSLPSPLRWHYPSSVMFAAASVIVMHLHAHLRETNRIGSIGPFFKACLFGFFTAAVLTCYGPKSEFIYFQF